jgi:hypothetical protein
MKERDLIGRLAIDDPLEESVWCFWCGEDTQYDDSVRPALGRTVHASDCPWVEARHLLGLPLGSSFGGQVHVAGFPVTAWAADEG